MIVIDRIEAWVEKNRDLALEGVRIYLGFAMFFKGIEFVRHGAELMQGLRLQGLPYDAIALTHMVAATHIVGGLLIAAGMLTRVAAAAQIPIVVGAIFYAHRHEGLFAPSHGLELALLVLFLLVAVTVTGGGRLSADRYLARPHEDEDEELHVRLSLPPVAPANMQSHDHGNDHDHADADDKRVSRG